MRNLEAMEEAKRATLIQESMLGGPVPAASPADMESLRTSAYDKVIAKAEETEKKRKLHSSGANGPDEPPAKKSKGWKPRWSTQRSSLQADSSCVPAGCAFMAATGDVERASAILEKVGFKIHGFTVAAQSYQEFVTAASTLTSRRQCGHVIVVENLARCSSTSPAAVLARLLGCFLCELSAVLALPKAGPAGVQYLPACTRPKHVAISSGLAARLPDLGFVLNSVSKMHGSKLKVASETKDIHNEYQAYKVKRGAGSKPWLSMRIGVTDQELNSLTSKRKKFPNLYCNQTDFLSFLSNGVVGDSICPGRW